MRLRNIPRAEAVLADSSYVIKEPETRKNNWKKEVFGNDHPIHIEIGMGKGRFILTLAKENPDINYIGIERYSSVLLRAVETNAEDPLPNVRFLCFDATQITDIFAPGEVNRIYLNFSDPWPKARHARRRLTSSEYLGRYHQILATDGRIEFKTDNRELFDFSVEELKESEVWEATEVTYDLHHDASMNIGNVMTEYEEKFSSMNHPICKLIAMRQSN